MNNIKYSDIQSYIKDGYLKEVYHQKYTNLVLVNYTRKTELEKHWDDITKNCRSVVFDISTNKMVSKSLSKFFNYYEVHSDFPFSADLSAYEKLDGWFGQVFTYNGELIFTTRGMFEHDIVNDFVHKKISSKTIIEGYTYCFEIINKDTKIILDYDYEDIVLTYVFDNHNQREISLDEYKFVNEWRIPKIIKIDPNNFDSYLQLDIDNQEGSVVVDNITKKRTKLKFENYFEKHRNMSHFNDNVIFNIALKNSKIEYNELLEKLPDEFIDEYVSKVYAYNEAYMLLRDVLVDEYNGFNFSDEMTLINHIKSFNKVKCNLMFIIHNTFKNGYDISEIDRTDTRSKFRKIIFNLMKRKCENSKNILFL